MSGTVKRLASGIALGLLFALLVWVFAAAGNYNAWSAKTCEDAGLTWVKGQLFGDYGCADIIPFDQVERAS